MMYVCKPGYNFDVCYLNQAAPIQGFIIETLAQVLLVTEGARLEC
jgi:hypothetical protein